MHPRDSRLCVVNAMFVVARASNYRIFVFDKYFIPFQMVRCLNLRRAFLMISENNEITSVTSSVSSNILFDIYSIKSVGRSFKLV